MRRIMACDWCGTKTAIYNSVPLSELKDDYNDLEQYPARPGKYDPEINGYPNVRRTVRLCFSCEPKLRVGDKV